jgi:hypothetical protein
MALNQKIVALQKLFFNCMSAWCKPCDRKLGQGQCSFCYREREHPAVALGVRDRGAIKVLTEAQRVHAVALKRSRGVTTTSIASPTKVQAHGVLPKLTLSHSPDRVVKRSKKTKRALMAATALVNAIESAVAAAQPPAPERSRKTKKALTAAPALVALPSTSSAAHAVADIDVRAASAA